MRYLTILSFTLACSLGFGSITAVVTEYPDEVRVEYKELKTLSKSERYIRLTSDTLKEYGYGDIEYYLDREIFNLSGLGLLESWYDLIVRAFAEGKSTVRIKSESLSPQDRKVLKSMLSSNEGLGAIVDSPDFELEFSTLFILKVGVNRQEQEVRFLDPTSSLEEEMAKPRVNFVPQTSDETKKSMERLKNKLPSPISFIASSSSPALADSMRINGEALRLAAEYASERQKKQRMYLNQFARMVDDDRFKIGPIPPDGLVVGQLPNLFTSQIFQKLPNGFSDVDSVRLRSYSVQFGIRLRFGKDGSRQGYFLSFPY